MSLFEHNVAEVKGGVKEDTPVGRAGRARERKREEDESQSEFGLMEVDI